MVFSNKMFQIGSSRSLTSFRKEIICELKCNVTSCMGAADERVSRTKHGHFIYRFVKKKHCFGCWLVPSNCFCIISPNDNAEHFHRQPTHVNTQPKAPCLTRLLLSDKTRQHSSMFGDATNQ